MKSLRILDSNRVTQRFSNYIRYHSICQGDYLRLFEYFRAAENIWESLRFWAIQCWRGLEGLREFSRKDSTWSLAAGGFGSLSCKANSSSAVHKVFPRFFHPSKVFSYSKNKKNPQESFVGFKGGLVELTSIHTELNKRAEGFTDLWMYFSRGRISSLIHPRLLI